MLRGEAKARSKHLKGIRPTALAGRSVRRGWEHPLVWMVWNQAEVLPHHVIGAQATGVDGA